MRKTLGRPYFTVYEKKKLYIFFWFRTARSLRHRFHFMMNTSQTKESDNFDSQRRHLNVCLNASRSVLTLLRMNWFSTDFFFRFVGCFKRATASYWKSLWATSAQDVILQTDFIYAT